jgi:hypothetical protein
VHYHHGMKAGQNTLNALCTRVVTRGMAAEKGYSTERFLQDYVKFMSTPGSHEDTYAGKPQATACTHMRRLCSLGLHSFLSLAGKGCS